MVTNEEKRVVYTKVSSLVSSSSSSSSIGFFRWFIEVGGWVGGMGFVVEILDSRSREKRALKRDVFFFLRSCYEYPFFWSFIFGIFLFSNKQIMFLIEK